MNGIKRIFTKQINQPGWMLSSSFEILCIPARGRELLESLLMDFESRSRSEKDDFHRVDIAKLRRELGLAAS
jgi:hypothetical protein